MNTKNTLYALLAIVAAAMLPACIEDGFTVSPADQPTFSADTLHMGDVFTLEGSPTRRFTVYNRHDKMLNISSVSLRDDARADFRLNVDGISGRDFADVEIRPNDSIFIFVEATLPENGTETPVNVRRHLDFVTNGVTTTVVLDINGQDVIRCDGLTISSDTRFDGLRPYLISGALTVAEGVSLTIGHGVAMRFREGASLKVEGSLHAEGTPQNPIEMTGHRTGFVAADIPYELMSGQWEGIAFAPSSSDNTLAYTSIRNTVSGIILDKSELFAENCQMRNSAGYVIDATHSAITATGCELTDASSGILNLTGGSHRFNHCTIANYYLFTALGGPSVNLSHIDAESDDGSDKPMMTATFTNSIIYGNGITLSHSDLTGTAVTFRRCLFGDKGSDDDNFIGCLWDADPLYYTVRREYLFDYRLRPESPAIAAADPTLDTFTPQCDRLGVTHTAPADLGAYAYTAPEE